MTKDNYIVMLAWMNELGLSLVEKTVYAIIYGFSQDGASEFTGSRQYLAEWCGCSSLRTIDAALNKLVERELITKKVKTVSGVRFCSYAATCASSAKIAQGVAQNCPEGSAKNAHNNIVNNIDNNIESKGDAKRFTPPTFEEVSAYCAERRNRISPQHFIDFYSANGWMVGRNRMKDWRAAVRNWETREKEKRNGTSNIDKGSPAAYRHLGRGDDYGPSTL